MGYSNINFDDLMEDDFENDDKEKKVEPVAEETPVTENTEENKK